MSNAPSLEIRLIRPEEIEVVSELLVDAYASAYSDLHENYRRELANVAPRIDTQEVWVAIDTVTGLVLGTVGTPLPGQRLSDFAGPLDLDFRMLAVSQQARGRGVGRALVEHCAALAKDRGASRLVLHTGDDMDLAVAFYERMGFERLTEIERDFPYPPGVWYPVRVYGMELAAR
ncbi:MAG: GNAT family N-acetyltransferase [Actinobacteria bacterium]|nr:GNAT family N-acetyltransferase [Actinomycetota bacterium]